MPITFAKGEYQGLDAQVSWRGVALQAGADLDAFMQSQVADRLNDTPAREAFHTRLRDLPLLTGFGKDALEEILDAEVPEERDWAVGEALAEAVLTEEYGVQWPWNTERDKRNPKASLQGADIVGFVQQNARYQLALGEVKTSGENKFPPQVMSGKSGMAHQIDVLATKLGTVYQLMMWLHPRCKDNEFEAPFEEAVTDYCNSGNKKVALFGILIRDTKPNELDLKARGKTLGATVPNAASCKLLAVYLPHEIKDLTKRTQGGGAP